MMDINQKWNQRTALGWIWLALTGFLATAAQSHLIIDVYPSQYNPDNQTIWTFGHAGAASGRVNYASTIRSSGNFHRRDSWKLHLNNPISQFPNVTNFYTINSQPTSCFLFRRYFPAPTTRKTSSLFSEKSKKVPMDGRIILTTNTPTPQRYSSTTAGAKPSAVFL